TSIVFSPAGKMLASAGGDKTISGIQAATASVLFDDEGEWSGLVGVELLRIRVALVFGIAALAAGTLAGQIAAAGPSISLSPTSGPPGSSISVKGTGFGQREMVAVSFDAKQVGSAFTDPLGRFSSTIKAPATASPG